MGAGVYQPLSIAHQSEDGILLWMGKPTIDQSFYYSILQEELIPALGCTEPVAIAYAAAACRQALGTIPDRVQAELSPAIIKNAKAVTVPNSGGMKGIEASIALGVVAGDASAGLEVLKAVKSTDLPLVEAFLADQVISIQALKSHESLHIFLHMQNNSDEAVIEIIGQHTNIVRLERNGESLLENLSNTSLNDESDEKSSTLTLEGILSFAVQADPTLLETLIGVQIEQTLAICNEGLENDWGASVGKTVRSFSSQGDLIGTIASLTAAGSDARMGGCNMPVVTNSGSGNQGITAAMPVVVYCLEHHIERPKMIQALAISNLLAIHQKRQIGRLSAFCGVVSAACGAAAAITWLRGGTLQQIEFTISNTLGTVSGMVCDGAKPSCAGKIAVAVYAAMVAHEMAMSNRFFNAGEGIVKDDIEDTVSGVGQIASEGMADTDRIILDIMLRK